jgi:mannose-6-phosphate isomerase-like protein (cupin superfamily)
MWPTCHSLESPLPIPRPFRESAYNSHHFGPAAKRGRHVVTTKISLNEKFGLFSDHWRPKVIAALNGQEVKIVKVKGEFPWHHHENEDEFFMVWKGRFRVEFRDSVVAMEPGDCVVVPRGVEHRTCASDEAEVLCFEPAGVLNTGNLVDETYTAPRGASI